ncbi:hypothetical protein MKEN_00178300 [Mycena kentingensis (nom. inval.)]|nr:hypothetical protein MKEN_00178300 [Mycena kentingensis (nom. inval.)]
MWFQQALPLDHGNGSRAFVPSLSAISNLDVRSSSHQLQDLVFLQRPPVFEAVAMSVDHLGTAFCRALTTALMHPAPVPLRKVCVEIDLFDVRPGSVWRSYSASDEQIDCHFHEHVQFIATLTKLLFVLLARNRKRLCMLTIRVRRREAPENLDDDLPKSFRDFRSRGRSFWTQRKETQPEWRKMDLAEYKTIWSPLRDLVDAFVWHVEPNVVPRKPSSCSHVAPSLPCAYIYVAATAGRRLSPLLPASVMRFKPILAAFSLLSPVSALINPILPGWNPDPSITRVGKDYFIATSTFEYFPGHPIYHSTDLVSWKLIGHALNRRSQLALFATPEDGGLWAPTLRYHTQSKTFYLVTTARYAYTAEYRLFPRSFFVTTKEIFSNNWSDPVYFDNLGYDPDLFWDPSGALYLTWSGNNNPIEKTYSIYQNTISATTGDALTPARIIFRGILPDNSTARPEGPHVYLINSTYYLVIAEGGSSPQHRVTVQRSNVSAAGPWESNPANPILFNGADMTLPVQFTGHADMVEGADGRWWGVALGTRPQAPGDFNHMQLGRETFLFPVTWSDGWPVFNGGQPLSEHIPNVLADKSPLIAYTTTFSPPPKNIFLDGYYSLRTPYKPFWSFPRSGGCALRQTRTLRATATPPRYFCANSLRTPRRSRSGWRSYRPRRTRRGYTTTPSIGGFEPNAPGRGFGLGPEAGVSVFYSDQLHNDVGVVGAGVGQNGTATEGRQLVVRKTVLGTQVGEFALVYTNATVTTASFHPLRTKTGTIRLRIVATPMQYTLSFAEEGDEAFTEVLAFDSAAVSVPPVGYASTVLCSST